MIHTLVRRYLVGALVLAAAGLVQAQTVETFAGGRIIDNMPANEAPLTPGKLAVGPDGAIYITNEFSHFMMRRDPLTGILTRGAPGPFSSFYNPTHYAFFGRPGYAYLARDFVLYERNLSTGSAVSMAQLLPYGATQCFFNHPHEGDMAVDGNGTVYFTEWDRHAVCRIIGPNNVVRFGGNGTAGFAGDGGPVAFAQFNYPTGVVADAANNIYIADTDNSRIRRVSAATGIITTIAGTGVRAHSGDNIPAVSASFNAPRHLAFDAQGNLYVSEHVRVRLINAQTGLVTTIAGNGTFSNTSPDGGLATQTPLGWIEGIGLAPNGDLIISDTHNKRVRRVARATGIITSVIGNGTTYFCGDNSTPRNACLHEPVYLAVGANDDVYISDSINGRVRKVSAATGLITTVAGSGSGAYPAEGTPAVDAKFPYSLGGVALDAAGNLYIAGASGNRISRVDRVTGLLTTVAGSGVYGFSGDGGPATAARTSYIPSVAFDDAGNLYFSDTYNNRVRKVAAGTGIITTVAGNGNSGGPLGDGGPATSASLHYPEKVGFDAQGNLLIADAWHKRIRRVNKTTGIITTVAGNGTQNSSGDGGPAINAGINNATNFTVDPAGNILLVDGGGVRRVDANTGFINWITATNLRSPEGFIVAFARDVALDSIGRLYAGTYDAVLRVNGLPVADSTPPIITANITGTAGLNGWYRSDVSLSWSVTDPESSNGTSSGCNPSSVTTDTAGITFTCSATTIGGTATRSVTIRRDTVAPTLTFGSATPAPDASGWNSTDVNVPFVANDTLSGIYTTSSGSPLSISGEGRELTGQVIVTDYAGNNATFTTPAVNIDRSAPLVTPNVSGTLGSNGWYTSDVEVSWTTNDDNAPVSTTSGCDTGTVNADTAGVTFTCTATSAGGSTTQSVTVKRDSTAPQLEFGAPTPAANAAGWHSGDVSIPFTTSDATSGVATTSTPSPLLFSGVGANLSTDVVVTDAAGNSATFASPAVNIDRSAPTVTANVSGTLGANGWYTSDIQVAWTTSDENAPVDSSEGCDTSTVASDIAGVTFTCTATSAGGSTTESVTVRRDATPPQLIFGAPTPAPNSVGWFNSDVSFAFDTTDATSGVASTSSNSPVVVTGEGAGLGAQVVITDGAGNSATFDTPAVNIDRAPPTVEPAISGVLGDNGWYTSDVQVSWTINESPASVISSDGCGTSSVIADTASVTFTCSVVSGGGTVSSSVTIKRDATPPVLTFGTPTPAPNVNGWNKTNVSVPFTRSDALAGLASTSTTSPLVISTEGAGVTGQVTVTDLAGNSATFTTAPRNIDKVAPVVSLVSPANGASYGFYQDVIGDYSCTDNVSLQSCVGPTAHGELVNTRAAGARTFRVTGKDQVPYTTAVTHSFTVASLFNFAGFLAPSSEPPTLNLVARGSLVPIRWQLPDGYGGFVTNPASFTSASVASLTCGSAPIVPYSDSASGPAGISFDNATNTFTYHWQTNPGWTGCRKLTIKLRDNTLHELRFRFQ